MSNDHTSPGRISLYPEVENDPVEVEDVRQPAPAVSVRTERDQRLANWQALLGWLRANPVIEVDPYQLGTIWYVDADTDADGAAKMEHIAATLGANLQPGNAERHYRIAVEYTPGRDFDVVYITDAYRAATGNRRHVFMTAEDAAAVAGETDA